jgi:hemerythrin-like domain-containing protein
VSKNGELASVADDPIGELTHDHGALSTLVLAVRASLNRLERGETTPVDVADDLGDGTASLHDALLVHFAREEEGLFPFVVDELPAMHARAEALRVEHDAICAAAADLMQAARLLHSGGGVVACAATMARFEELYATHSQLELAFLKDVGQALSVVAREKLRAILAST